MFYKLRDFIDRHLFKIIIITIISVIVIGVSLLCLSRKVEDKNIEDTSSEFSLNGLENELPKNINGVYEGLNNSLINNEDIYVKYNKEGYIEVYDSKTDRIHCYLRYDERYDCTLLSISLKQENPDAIFYHYLYEGSSDMYDEIQNFIKNTILSEKVYDVNLKPNEDGSVNLTIN